MSTKHWICKCGTVNLMSRQICLNCDLTMAVETKSEAKSIELTYSEWFDVVLSLRVCAARVDSDTSKQLLVLARKIESELI